MISSAARSNICARHPVDRLTIAGGFAKLAKLAAGHLDLHSVRSRVDPAALAARLTALGAGPETVAAACGAESAGAILAGAGEWRAILAGDVARSAREVALATLERRDCDRCRRRRSKWQLCGAGRVVMARGMVTGRLLILGGTAEAAALARAAMAQLGDDFVVTTSLAGRTARPGPIPGQVRIGGFGGHPGLAAYLKEHAIDRVIDATHPFAARISTSARHACDTTGVPRLILLRPPWRRHPLDRWIEVGDMAAAAGIVARIGRRALLTIGAGEIAAFSGITGVRFLVRLVDPPRRPLPLRFCEIVVGRGPFALADERHLIARHAIDVLVCKASGGDATQAKLIAAREFSLPVVMMRRPPPEPGEVVDTVEEALAWLASPRSFSPPGSFSPMTRVS